MHSYSAVDFEARVSSSIEDFETTEWCWTEWCWTESYWTESYWTESCSAEYLAVHFET
jgi:hypothetical protein